MTLRAALYSGVTLTAAAVLPPFLLASTRGRRRLLERYGVWGLDGIKNAPVYWFHGASIGEVNSLLPLIERFEKSQKMQQKVLLSSTSVTGVERLSAKHIIPRLLPFDHSIFFKRALDRLNLQAFVFGETELWPNLLAYLEERDVPTAIVNARISAKSFSRYHLFGTFLSDRLTKLRAVCCATEVARQRFVTLGADPANVHVVGNSKFDVSPSLDSSAAEALRVRLFSKRGTVVVLGSLRPGEEDYWFGAIARMQRESSALQFIIAPRHTEKFDFFANRLRSFNIEFMRASNLNAPANISVILLDSLGQLEQMYSIASLAFVGGTMVSVGGHSPVEAAAYGVALAGGQWRANIEEIMTELQRAGAVIDLKSECDVENMLRQLQTDPEHFVRAGIAAKTVWQQNRGVTERTQVILKDCGVLGGARS